jgi:hypothetical protein
VRANEGLTKFFHVIRVLPVQWWREAHDVACVADQITSEPLLFGVMTRTALLVSGIALRSLQCSSTGKRTPVGMCQPFEKARLVRLDLNLSFTFNRCRPRVLTARERVKALTKKNRLTSHSHAGRRPARECCAGRSARRSHGPEGDHVRCQNLELSLITACNHANVFSTRRKDFGGVAIRTIMRSITA